MTDAELSRAVADACGICTKTVSGMLYYAGGYLSFDPATDWSDAFYAAEKCGLFTKHNATLEWMRKEWQVTFYYDESDILDGRTNATGPRAICEAILAVTGKGEA